MLLAQIKSTYSSGAETSSENEELDNKDNKSKKLAKEEDEEGELDCTTVAFEWFCLPKINLALEFIRNVVYCF